MPNYRRFFLNNHSYFITIVTYNRNPLLIDNIALLRESFKKSKEKYIYSIDAIVILPEHLHMIITPQNPLEYPKIISTIKAYFSKNCDKKYYIHLEQSQSRLKKRYKAVWQKKYYEHTIRNDKDREQHINYIHNNPIKHKLVDNINEWAYSSYHKRKEM